MLCTSRPSQAAELVSIQCKSSRKSDEQHADAVADATAEPATDAIVHADLVDGEDEALQRAFDDLASRPRAQRFRSDDVDVAFEQSEQQRLYRVVAETGGASGGSHPARRRRRRHRSGSCRTQRVQATDEHVVGGVSTLRLAAHEHAPDAFLVEGGPELLEQAGLADAGRADQRDRLTGTGTRFVEAVREQSHLPRATDQRSERTAEPSGHAGTRRRRSAARARGRQRVPRPCSPSPDRAAAHGRPPRTRR